MRCQPRRRCICQKPPDYYDCWRKNVHKCGKCFLPPSRRPKQWDSIEAPEVPLKRKLARSPTGRIVVGKKARRSTSQTRLEKVPTWEWLYVHRKSELFLSVEVDNIKTWKFLRHEVGRSGPFGGSSILGGCARRGAEVDHHVVQANAYLFRRSTTTEVMHEKQNRNTNHSQPITA